jgi:hypothetical protein
MSDWIWKGGGGFPAAILLVLMILRRNKERRSVRLLLCRWIVQIAWQISLGLSIRYIRGAADVVSASRRTSDKAEQAIEGILPLKRAKILRVAIHIS